MVIVNTSTQVRLVSAGFLNIRMSPVDIINQSAEKIESDITRLVQESDNPWLTGVCCINMDHNVTDDKVTTILETTEALRKQYAAESRL